MLDLVLYGTLTFFVLYVSYINNMWGVSKGTKKAREDVKLEKSRAKSRKRWLWFLDKCVWISDNVGFSLVEYKAMDLQYKIERLGIRIKILDRLIKPKELHGFLKLVRLVGTFIFLYGVIISGSMFFIIFGVLFFAPSIFNAFSTVKIMDEDEKLERAFPDFFLVMYNRLLKGTDNRLAPTLNDYLRAIDGVNTKENAVLRKFVKDLRSNIDIYADDVLAVRKLREKYTSVMIVNFCNLAVQALNGVDNSDKLLSFKIELNQKQLEEMKKKADKLVFRGSIAIYAIYLVLFQFVGLSWLAKLTQADGMGSILGIFGN